MKRFFAGIVILLYGSVVCFAQMQNKQVISLDSVFALVERNSTYLKLSESVVEISQSAAEAAESSRLPSVDVSLSAKHYGDALIWDRDFTNRESAAIPAFGNDFSLQASLVIFAGGAVSNSIEKAELETQVAQLSHEKNRNDIRFLVAGNYLNLFRLFNQKKVFERNVEQTDEVIRQVKAKMQAGMALDNDLTRYELLRKTLELSIIETENNISTINQHLVTTLGLSDETLIIPDTSIQYLDTALVPGGDYLAIAKENRQEIKIRELNKSIARKDIALAKAGIYPSVTLTGGDYLTGPVLVEVPPLNKNLNYWYAGVTLSYNIGSLYKSGKNISVAQKALDRANLAYIAGLEETKTAIHSACIKYSEAHEKLAVYEKSYELARQNYMVVNNRYQNDLVLITEMLDAGNMKLNAELQVINARLDVVYRYFNLLRETGTL